MVLGNFFPSCEAQNPLVTMFIYVYQCLSMLFFPGPDLNSWKCERKASWQMLANVGNAGSAVLEFSLQLLQF